MENKNLDNVSKKPNTIVMLPFLVLVLCVYGDTQRHTTGTKETLASPFYSADTGFSIDIPASPAIPISLFLFYLVLSFFYKIPGTAKQLITRPRSRVLAIRGPPF